MLHSLKLVNFRTYTNKTFKFFPITLIIGANTVGKTNILEAINMLVTGTSFRAEKDSDLIYFGRDFARVEAVLQSENETILISLLMQKMERSLQKRFLVNGIPRRKLDIASKITTVLFAPHDLEIISESPSIRRRYFDNILSQADPFYHQALNTYEKALRQRNRLLSLVQEGKRPYSNKEFEYWNSQLLEQGAYLTQKRQEYLEYVNSAPHTTFQLQLTYDHSIFSLERAEKYRDAEVSSGMTLIGPQRDDFLIQFPTERLIKEFASRGEQRLAILQLKLLEIEYLKKSTHAQPILLLDDIFSELDAQNIEKIVPLLPESQAIITTTHKELVPKEFLPHVSIINLP